MNKVGGYSLKYLKSQLSKLIPVFGLSALAGSGAVRQRDEGAQEAGTVRNAKSRPPGHEGTKANYKTIDK